MAITLHRIIRYREVPENMLYSLDQKGMADTFTEGTIFPDVTMNRKNGNLSGQAIFAIKLTKISS